MGTADSREKNKRVVRNIASYLLYNFTIVAFGLIIPRLYLLTFGSEANGLVNTVKMIYGYLSLLEAGVGAAAQQALYKPVATSQNGRVNAILAATHRFYLRAGITYLGISLAFAVIYPLVIHTEINRVAVFLIILFYAVPEVLKFLIQGKYRIFLEVEGKAYVLNNLITAMMWVSNIIKLLGLLFGSSLILIEFTYCLPAIVQLPVTVLYVRRKYPWIDLKVKADVTALKQKTSVLVHQISGVMFSITDTVVISVICGFQQASVYTIYMLFFNNIEKLIKAFTDGINFRLGQLFQTDRKKFTAIYNIYESLYYIMVFTVYTVAAGFLLPIIELYTKGVEDVNYVNPVMIILFSITNLLVNIKTPANQVLLYAGCFDKTRHHAVIEMTINIVVSIGATIKFGIAGALAGSIAALLYRSNAFILYTCHKILKTSCLTTYKRCAVNISVAVLIISLIGTQSCEATGYVSVCLKAGLNAVWIFLAFFAANAAADWKTVRQLLTFIRQVVQK